MKEYDEIRERQTGKRSAFTIMSNIRDHCKQSDAKKVLMFSIALYCDSDGLCFPGNRLLAKAMNKSERTVKRMLKELKADGELEILRPGIGRSQQRVIRLTRYAAIAPEMPLGKGDKAMTRLNGTRSPGKTARNCQGNNHRKGKGAVLHLRSERTVFVPKVPYPETEKEFYDTLERRGIEPNPDYDGNFFAQMQASGWTIKDNPVFDWPTAYQARLEVTMP
jgi:hypothetical protein